MGSLIWASDDKEDSVDRDDYVVKEDPKDKEVCSQ